jgi:uncharacterized membrane protein (Fun14 family)
MTPSDLDNSAFNDIFSASFMLGSVGAPFVIGLAVGYFAKKMLRLALIFGGAAIVLLFVSEYYGIVTVNDDGLQRVADHALQAAQDSGSFLVHRLSSISAKGLSAAAGFYFGLKLG